MLVFYALFIAVWTTVVRHGGAVGRPGADFSVFWSASYVMLHGTPAQAYDFSSFSRLTAELFTIFVATASRRGCTRPPICCS